MGATDFGVPRDAGSGLLRDVLRPTAALLVALLPGLASAAAPAPKRPKLAVAEIAAPEGSPGLTALLSEVALTEASSTGRFAVIGQSDVTAMLGHERQRQLMGCFETSGCVSQLGNVLAVDFLLVGTVGTLGARWRLDVKLVDVKRGTVAARLGEVVDPDPERLAEALQRGVRGVIVEATTPGLPGRQRAGWIVGAVGGACLVGSGLFALQARAAWRDLEAARAAGDAAAWDRQRSRVRSRALAADLLLGAGLAGAGTGAWLLLGGEGGRGIRIGAAPGGAALAFEGSF
jgi:TolB-like protein